MKKILVLNTIFILLLLIFAELTFYVLYRNDVHYPISYVQTSLKDYLYEYPPFRYKKYENVNFTKKPILYLGCSYTYGEALNDDETMPKKIEKITGRHGYNMGMSGKCAVQSLMQLLLENEYHLINEKPEFIIYTFMFHHIDRLFDAESYDFYRKRNYVPFQKYNILYKSYLYKHFKDVELSKYLFNGGKYDVLLNLYYTVLKDIKAEGEKLFPDSKFVILIYSDVNHDLCKNYYGKDNENENRLKEMFEIMESKDFKHNLEQIGYTVITTEELIGRKMDREDDRNSKTIDPNYPHPSAKAWDEVVPQLCKRLKL